MIDPKRFSGIMNTDDKPEDITAGQHIDAVNIRFYGGANGLTAENIVGNTLIVNQYKPAGDNECVGAFFDGIKQRIIWFNWNSNDTHGIYQYSIETQTITRLLENFTNSQTDILLFDRDYPIASVDIIYTTEIDGDILTWTARNNKPKALNLLQAENNTYGSDWLEEYLDVAKEPPLIPPKCAYEDDATVIVNNLRKRLFKPKYRHWLPDNEKSTWSSSGEVPVPFNYTDPETDTDPTKNCRIGIVVQTGDASVSKIEIAIAESLGNVFSNYFSVIILDKAELGIPDNDVYLWRFYNNEVYDYVDLRESNLLFDRVPDKANTQALLNGNVIVYGGITEGLDPIVPDVDMTVGTEYPLAIDSNNAFSVTQYGEDGFVEGENIRFIVIGTIRRGQTFTADVLVGVTTFTITYTAVVGDTTTEVMIGLSASATGQGFTQVSIDDNQLVISRVNQILLLHNITTTNQSISATFTITNSTKIVKIVGGASFLTLFTKGVWFYIYGNTLNVNPFKTVSSVVNGADLDITVEETLADETIATTLYFVPPVNSSIPAYNSSSKENWCLFYFQNKGKTNEVTTRIDFNANTNPLGLDVSVNTILYLTPYINAQINHRPPLWATSYQWGRSLNLTKDSYLFWVTGATYKDDKYAYISIESIEVFKRLNPKSVISYDFLAGDRIKFYVLYDQDANPVFTYGNEHDYEIYDVVVNPEVFDIVKIGTYVKIVLPTVSGTFNFGSDVVVSPNPARDFNNYYIELYTPAKAAAEGLEVYYEFGEEYTIIDAGTANRCHQGQLQNQSDDLITPATFKFNKGDAWYRTRSIQVGNILIYDLVAGIPFGTSTILGQRLRSKDYDNSDYALTETIGQQPFINNYNSPGWTINVLLNTYTFKVKGIINLVATNTTSSSPRIYIFVVYGTTTVSYLLGNYTGSFPIGTGQTITYNVNTNIIMPPNSKSFLHMVSTDGNFRCTLDSGFLSYTEPQKEFVVGVVDQNFSDFYESKVNSNGRAMKVNPDEKTNFFGTLLRWGAAYIQNTNINQINRFFPDNFNEIDRSKGDIQRFKSRDRSLRIFQNRAVGQYGVYAKYIQSNDNDPNLVTTDKILTSDNITYYAGELGLGDQYTGLISAINVDYGVYPVTGDHWRLSNDGFTKIGDLYKGQFYIRDLFIPYNKTYLRANGATAKILGAFDFREGQCIPLLQGGTNNGNTTESYAFSFNEIRNGYCSFYSYKEAEWLLSAEDILCSFKDGDMWLHNNENQRCNFFGTQYSASITLVFNINLLEKKTWQSVSELASAIWACPLIYTNVKSYGTQRQESELGEFLFTPLEDMFEAAFRRDINSRGGLYNGDVIKGNYIVIMFEKDNASDLITLSEVVVMAKDSPLTNK